MTSVHSFGEFEIIRDIRRKTRVDRSVILGIGDDTAILKPDASKETLFTTDMLIEDIHFRLKEATAYQIGRKALAVNVSDIAAMGGTPKHAVISVGLPSRLNKEFITELYRGIHDLARHFKINLVGGDTNASEKLVLSVALLGTCVKSGAIRRSGAKVGDVIFVSGELGGSYASRKHLLFMPRVREAEYLMKNFKVHAMMDISDGLAGDIRRLTEESRVGALICGETVPVSKSALGLEAALTDGEDFELLFTLSPQEATRLSLSRGKEAGMFRPIGKIIDRSQGLHLVDKHGQSRPLPAGGFDHFA